MSVTFLDDDVLAHEQPESPREQNAVTREYHFFIGNGGTRNGVSREFLTALLDNVDSLYMPESKDFSFTSVTGKHQALYLLNHCNGVCVQDTCKIRNLCHLISPSLLEGPPLYLYLSLVDHIPAVLQCEVSGDGRLPPGLILIPDFISGEEERELVDYFTASECEAEQCEPERSKNKHPSQNSALLQHTLPKPSLPRDETYNIEPGSPASTATKTLTAEGAVHLSPSPRHSLQNSQNLPAPVTSTLKHRRVTHYGYEFLYGSNRVDPDKPLPGGTPAVCTPLLERMREHGLLSWLPDQLTVNDYLPGAGTPIAALYSLQNVCVCVCVCE